MKENHVMISLDAEKALDKIQLQDENIYNNDNTTIRVTHINLDVWSFCLRRRKIRYKVVKNQVGEGERFPIATLAERRESTQTTN